MNNISRRDRFAMAAMHSIMVKDSVFYPTTRPNPTVIASDAIKYADALIAELDKPAPCKHKDRSPGNHPASGQYPEYCEDCGEVLT